MDHMHTLPTTNATLQTPYIRVTFPVQGSYLPADHGYLLYAAISKTLPHLHGVSWLGIERISGIPGDKGMITLPTSRTSLHLRLPAVNFADVLPLAGKRLEIAGYTVRVGPPLSYPLVPAVSLYARIVTIKNFTEPKTFLDAAYRQLTAIGINATLELPNGVETRYRRIINIHNKKVVGFSLIAHSMSDQDSITLQNVGLGGRRKMGCGLFNPIAKARAKKGDAL